MKVCRHGIDLTEKFKRTVVNIKQTEDNQSEKSKNFAEFHELFETNTPIKDAEIEIQSKQRHYSVKPNVPPKALHLQEDVGNEVQHTRESGNWKRSEKSIKTVVSLVGITMKDYNSVEIALGSIKF